MKRALLKALLAVLFFTICSFVSVAAQKEQSVSNDKDVKIVSFQPLAYPPLARNARIQGTVVIRVTLDDKGSVREAVPISGTLDLTSVALSNVVSWSF